MGYRGTKRDQQESVHTYILHVNTVLLLLLLLGIGIGTTSIIRMSYFRPSFKVDRTQRPPIRTSFGLQLRSDRGQVLLRSADQNDLFVNKGHVHRPDSTVLETILANKIGGSRAPSRSNQNHTKHIVSFKPGGTLQRPEIASARERKTQYLNTLAKRREKMVALRYARNTFGFTNARTEHEYKVFSKFATDTASPMQLHLTQLIVALGKVHYPSLCSFANDSSDDDDDLYSDADDSENNCRNPILKDIAIWLLHRHSESGFISLNQWISIQASGDIDTAFDVVTRDRDQVFVVGRKNGGFRPAKGHQYEPKTTMPNVIQTHMFDESIKHVRKSKSMQVNNADRERVRVYVERRGRHLGNAGFFLSGHLSLGALVKVALNIAGEDIVLPQVFTFSMAQSTVRFFFIFLHGKCEHFVVFSVFPLFLTSFFHFFSPFFPAFSHH